MTAAPPPMSATRARIPTAASSRSRVHPEEHRDQELHRQIREGRGGALDCDDHLFVRVASNSGRYDEPHHSGRDCRECRRPYKPSGGQRGDPGGTRERVGATPPSWGEAASRLSPGPAGAGDVPSVASAVLMSRAGSLLHHVPRCASVGCGLRGRAPSRASFGPAGGVRSLPGPGEPGGTAAGEVPRSSGPVCSK